MVDVAVLSFSVDSKDAQQADRDLARLTSTAQRTQAQARNLQNEIQRTGGSLAALSRTNQQATAHQTAFGRSTTGAATSLAGLRRTYDQATVAATAFGRANQHAATQAQAAGAGFDLSSNRAKSFGAQANVASRHVGNMTAQLNDIGVMMASGQSPLQLALQQGTQVSQIFQAMGNNGRSAFAALRAGLGAMISPMSLATIGIIAGGAALVQWGLSATGAANSALSLEDAATNTEDAMSAYREATDAALASSQDLQGQFGSLADSTRPFLQQMRELKALELQSVFDDLSKAMKSHTQGGLFQQFKDLIHAREAVDTFFNLDPLRTSGFTVDDFGTSEIRLLPVEIEKARIAYVQLNQEYAASPGELQKQHRILGELVGVVETLATAEGTRKPTTEQREYATFLLKTYTQMTEALAQQERASTGVSAAEQRRADWATKTLASMQSQTTEARSILQFGTGLEATLARQAESARASLEADIQRNKVGAGMAEQMRAELEARIATEAATKRQANSLAQQMQTEARLTQYRQQQKTLGDQRAHAAQSIAQRLNNEVAVLQAIVTHGKDSVQAKLAEQAVTQSLFELELKRQGITGEIRDNLIAKYQAAAKLKDRIAESQPAFNQLRSTIGGISQAWSDWIVRGFDDFKSFTRSIVDTFKRMLSQMIAQAIANPIMISLGMQPGILGGVANAAGGGGGLLSSLFGGGGGGLFSGIGKLFGGGGGGFLSGLFGGGGAATAASLTPVVGGGFAGAAAAGGGAAAAGGAGLSALLGPAGLAAATIAVGGPLIFAALKTKTKLLDEGIRVTIDAADVLVESYEKIQKSRFFGLSKKTRTHAGSLAENVAAPIEAAVEQMREQYQKAGRILGVHAAAVSDYSGVLNVSLKGLEGAARESALMEGLSGIGNQMAHAALQAAGLDVSLEKAGQRFLTLATTLDGVNTMLEAMGHQQFTPGIQGGIGAEGLVDQFGGMQQFQQATQQFFQMFYSESERMAVLHQQLSQTFADLNVQMPTSLEGYRALIEAQNLTTVSGQELYAQLIELGPQFHTLAQYEQERLAGIAYVSADTQNSLADLLTTFADLNTTLPTTSEEYLRLIEAQDWNTEAGKKLVTTLGDLFPQFQQVRDSELSLKLARDEMAKATQKAAAATTAAANAIAQAAEVAAAAAAKAAAAAAQAAAALGQANSILGAIQQGVESGASAQQLLDTFGGAGSLQTAVDSYYNTFVPEAERMSDTMRSVTQSLGELGLEVPKTKAGYRDLVESINLNTEAGQRAFEVLMHSADDFATVIDYNAKQAEAAGQAVARAAQAQADAMRREAQERQRLLDERARAERRVYELFTSEADQIADLRRQITAAGVPLDAAAYKAELARLKGTTGDAVNLSDLALDFGGVQTTLADLAATGHPDPEGLFREMAKRYGHDISGATGAPAGLARYDELLSYADDLAAVIQHEQRLAEERAREQQRRLEQAAREAKRLADERARREQAYYQAIIPEAERMSDLQASLTQSLARFNAELPGSVEGFRALVDAQDVSTAAGRRLRDVLVGLGPKFAQLAAYEQRLADERAAAAQQRAQQERQRREAERQRLEAQRQSFYNEFYSLGERQADTRRELTAGFSALGLALPRTRRAFRELVEETNPGSDLHRSLIGLSDRFAFLTNGTDELNRALGGTQEFFRTLAEEAFVRSAPALARPGAGTDGATVDGSDMSGIIGLLREILQETHNGNIDRARHLRDLLEEEQRSTLEPDFQTVDI